MLVGGAGVSDATNPMGVLVKVAVAVGRGVMLGKAVFVITTVCVAAGRVATIVIRGTDVKNCARTVAVMLIEGMLGAGAVAGSAVRHADAASNTAIAIKSGFFALFMTRPW